MLTLELQTRDFPEIYARFAKEVGEQHWKKRVAALKQEIKGNSLLEGLHCQEDSISFQLEQLRELHKKFGGHPVQAYNEQSHFPAASFAAQVLSVLDASPPVLAERFRRRVYGALRNPAEMRAIRLELMTATHFLRAGYKVSWPEMSEAPAKQGVGISDLLIEDLGPKGLEIECKSFSDEIGRNIARRQVLEFIWLLKNRHWDRLSRLNTGVVAVVTVQSKLPTEFKARVAMAESVARHILHRGPGSYTDGCARIVLTELDVQRLSSIHSKMSKSELRFLLDSVTGTKNKESIVMSTPNGGALVLAVQSERDDYVLDSIFETLRRSAPRQFSGARPGILVAGLNGLSAEQLLDVAMQEYDPGAIPTALRRHTSRFLESVSSAHLVGVSFLSSTSLRPHTVAGVHDSGGTAYYFPKKVQPFWSDEFSGIFGRQDAQLKLE